MIYYATPYSQERNLGASYNVVMRSLPHDTDFACFVDGDAMFTTSDFGHQIQRIVDENQGCGLFYARTNRIGCPWQLDTTVKGDDVRQHRVHGRALSQRFGTDVERVQSQGTPGSGFLILVRRSLWNRCAFKEEGILGVDWDFFNRVRASGETIMLMKGVYLYHWYRGGVASDTAHLASAQRIEKPRLCEMNQVESEFAAFLSFVQSRLPENFLEIGTDRGGSFQRIGNICASAGIKISLDVPRIGFWGGFDFGRLHRDMLTWFPNVHLVHADSHLETTRERIASILDGRRIDILFIDGDHSYEGVKHDFESYGRFVKSGGLIAFHDIVDSPFHHEKGCYVSRFWNELTGMKVSFTSGNNWGGIGVLVNSQG